MTRVQCGDRLPLAFSSIINEFYRNVNVKKGPESFPMALRLALSKIFALVRLLLFSIILSISLNHTSAHRRQDNSMYAGVWSSVKLLFVAAEIAIVCMCLENGLQRQLWISIQISHRESFQRSNLTIRKKTIICKRSWELRGPALVKCQAESKVTFSWWMRSLKLELTTDTHCFLETASVPLFPLRRVFSPPRDPNDKSDNSFSERSELIDVWLRASPQHTSTVSLPK